MHLGERIAEDGPNATRAARRSATRARQEELIDAIAARRRACGDESAEMLTPDPFGTLKYVLAHPGVPRAVLRQDAADAAELVRLARLTLDELEYGVILLARRTGTTWLELAKRQKLNSMQAAAQHFDALAAWLDPEIGRKDVAQLRAQRKQKSWARQHRAEIEALARDLLASDLPVQAAESAEELAETLREPVGAESTLVILVGDVYKDLDTAGQLSCLPGNLGPRLRQVVRDWARAGQPSRARSRNNAASAGSADAS